MLDTAISWSRVSDYIAHAMGLHFPGERLQDLQRGLAGAAAELGFDDATACADWMLTSPLSPADRGWFDLILPASRSTSRQPRRSRHDRQ